MEPCCHVAVQYTSKSGSGFGITTAELRAAYDRNLIYLQVVWDDPSATRNTLKKRRVFDGSAWSMTGQQGEDRVCLLWPITEALGTSTPGAAMGTTTPFRAAGCAMACHGDGVMRTDFGMLDAWHWKAALTNPLGFTDDKHFTAAGSGVSGRKGDDGLSSHFDNGTETVPGFQALSGAQGALSMQPVVNVAPQASAGQNQTVGGGISVNLNGSASFDPNGDPLTYAWVQTAGPVVALTGANTATPSFRRAHGPS